MDILAGAALITVGIVMWVLFVSVPLWLLWNWLCPELFGLPTISFLQALGLAFLSSILFRGGSKSSSKS